MYVLVINYEISLHSPLRYCCKWQSQIANSSMIILHIDDLCKIYL